MLQATTRGTTSQVGRVRYGIIAMLFAVTMINYADRATLSLAGAPLSRQLGLGPLALGTVFSAFGWTYMLAQVPSGWLLDRYGAIRVYLAGLVAWSVLTVLQGGVAVLGASAAVTVLFVLRSLVGVAEAPSFPANARIVAAWFPTNERGTASAIFNSAQYLATALFAPIMGGIITVLGWPWVFYLIGGLGLLLGLVWLRVMHEPDRHPWLGAAELAVIRAGGAVTDAGPEASKASNNDWGRAAQLLRSRMCRAPTG